MRKQPFFIQLLPLLTCCRQCDGGVIERHCLNAFHLGHLPLHGDDDDDSLARARARQRFGIVTQFEIESKRVGRRRASDFDFARNLFSMRSSEKGGGAPTAT